MSFLAAAALLAGCSGPAGDPWGTGGTGGTDDTRSLPSTFPVGGCQTKGYSDDGAELYALDGCPTLLAEVGSAAPSVRVQVPAGNTGFTVEGDVPRTTPDATLAIDLARPDGTVTHSWRFLFGAHAEAAAGGGRAAVQLVLAECGAADVTIRWEETGAQDGATHRVYRHTAADLDEARAAGRASCNGHRGTTAT